MNILVDTMPINARKKSSINMGYEIVRDAYGLRPVHFSDQLLKVPDIIYANVFYPTHLMNVVSFLKRNGIPVLKEEREQKLIVGGQGVSNVRCFDDIANEVFLGEADGDMIDRRGWHRKEVIDSPPRIKNGRATIELTRGCKYKCKFCEYSWVHGGRFREKDVELVKEQILYAIPKTRAINFMSANFGSYSKIDELIKFCDRYNIKMANSDVCIHDIGKQIPTGSIKVGVESFDEATRKFVNKPMSDEKLLKFFETAMPKISSLHCYLIYGLPNDNYNRWFDWLFEISKIRRAIEHPLRVDINITNFEPCIGTPLENAPRVNFKEKNEFIKEWGAKLIESGLKNDSGKPLTYGNAHGRIGRKEISYDLLMALKTQDNLTNSFLSSMHSGARRSISESSSRRFLSLAGTDINYNYANGVKKYKTKPIQLELLT